MTNVLEDNQSDVYSLDKREQQSLQQQLNEEAAMTDEKTAPEDALVAAELRKQKILEVESNRILSRVLFVVNQPALFKESELMATYGQFAEVFEEIHILLVASHKQRKLPTKRLAPNVWRYMATSRFRWWRPRAAQKVVEQELVFTGGFRPDIIVATDPFMAGLVTKRLAKRYDRPWQLHVTTSAFLEDPDFAKRSDKGKWQLAIAPEVIEHAPSIRCGNERIQQLVTEKFKTTDDMRMLPKFFDLQHLSELKTQPPAETLFPQFSITLMYIGQLDSTSLLHQVLDGARFLLQNPVAGLVVIGTGPLKEKFAERAALLGIKEQVLFLGKSEPVTKPLVQADLLLVPERTTAADELAIQAAALGTPTLLATNELRTTLFEDEVSALLVPADDVSAMSRKIKRFVDLNALRKSLSINGQRVVKTQIVEDPQLYRIAYRNAIEEVLYKKGQEQAHQEIAVTVKEALREARKQQKKYVDVNGLTMKLPKRD